MLYMDLEILYIAACEPNWYLYVFQYIHMCEFVCQLLSKCGWMDPCSKRCLLQRLWFLVVGVLVPDVLSACWECRRRMTAVPCRGVVLLLLVVALLWVGVVGQEEDRIVGGLPGQPSGGAPFAQYGGFVGVSPTRHLYYYMVESQRDPERDPLVLWLNGGCLWLFVSLCAAVSPRRCVVCPAFRVCMPADSK